MSRSSALVAGTGGVLVALVLAGCADRPAETVAPATASALAPFESAAHPGPRIAADIASMRRIVALDGGTRATAISFVRTDALTAERTLFPDSYSGGAAAQPAVVTIATGHFAGYMMKRPPGAPAARGTAIYAVYDVAGELTDWGILPSLPDTSSLGTFTEVV